MKMKQKLLVVAATALLGISSAAQAQFGGLSTWPVHDKDLTTAVNVLGKHFENMAEIEREKAKAAEDNVTTANAARARVAVVGKYADILHQTMPTVEKCVTVTKTLANQSLMGKAAQMDNAAQMQRLNNLRTGVVTTGTTLNRKEIGGCTQRDAATGVDGCTMADANAAKFGGILENPSAITNDPVTNALSVDPKQSQIAMQRMEEIAGLSMPKVSTESLRNNSAMAKGYANDALFKEGVMQAYQFVGNQYRGVNIAGSGEALGYNTSENNALYTALHGHALPANPSPMLLRGLAADTGKYSKAMNLQGQSVETVLKDIAVTMHDVRYELFEANRSLHEQIKLNALLLAQMNRLVQQSVPTSDLNKTAQ